MSKEISGICTSLVAVSDGLTGINASVAVKQILNLVVGSVFSFIVWCGIVELNVPPTRFIIGNLRDNYVGHSTGANLTS